MCCTLLCFAVLADYTRVQESPLVFAFDSEIVVLQTPAPPSKEWNFKLHSWCLKNSTFLNIAIIYETPGTMRTELSSSTIISTPSPS